MLAAAGVIGECLALTQKLTRLREYLRSSLWFLPSVCVALAFALAEVALRIDRSLDQEGNNWFLFGGGTEGARSVMSTIAMSMLTFTGLVFSVTMLVLQMASSQLSPRVMRTFLRDRANQMVLGVFVATFVYALLVLRRITDGAEAAGTEPFVPALSVWLALVLVLLSIGLFIYYIHHMAQAIRPVSVMASVGQETREAISRMYPGGIGETAAAPAPPFELPVSAIVLGSRSGVVTGVDEAALTEVAEDSGCVIELTVSVGDFTRASGRLFLVRGDWNSDAESRLLEALTIGTERTMQQDAAFGFRQIVDIAVRALSPGINDPTTAVQALDVLHDLLGRLVTRSIPSPVRELESGAALVLPRQGWAGYVALACDEIRRAGGDQVQIQRRMRAMLEDLVEVAPGGRKEPLEEQLALLDAQLEEAFEGSERQRAGKASAQGHGS